MINSQSFGVILVFSFLSQASSFQCNKCEGVTEPCPSQRGDCSTNKGCFKLAFSAQGKSGFSYGCMDELEKMFNEIKTSTDPIMIAAKTTMPFMVTLADNRPAMDKCTKKDVEVLTSTFKTELCYCSVENCNSSTMIKMSVICLAIGFFLTGTLSYVF